MGPPGAKKNPTYREVCMGNTGQVEVYDCIFDGKEETYEKLLKHFFAFHDPTTMNSQGNDRGTQYASAIFCYDDKQVQAYGEIRCMVYT
jgi:methionine-S-sulfoxide reductase